MPAPTDGKPPTQPEELSMLESTSAVGLADELRARAALASLLGGPHERAALSAVLAASRAGRAPPSLTEAAAGLLLARGEASAAAALLESSTTVDGLALRADARLVLGELQAACADLERALRLDVRAPGLLERRDRLRARLGLSPLAPPVTQAQATLITAGGPRVSYRIVGEAGRGGAATVYQAEDDALGRTLALKLYHRPREHAEQVAREARGAAAVAGPGVVRVLDASLDDGWIALAWAPCGSLRDALTARAPHASPDVWLARVVSALARVHRAGWVHGDVKPANVLFRADHAPMLADFGLARRAGEAHVGGTPGFLSPERLRSSPASPADDVYALGRTLEIAAEALRDDRFRALARRFVGDARPADAGAIELAEVAASAASTDHGASTDRDRS